MTHAATLAGAPTLALAGLPRGEPAACRSENAILARQIVETHPNRAVGVLYWDPISSPAGAIRDGQSTHD